MLAKCNRLLQIKVLTIDYYKLKQQSNCGANETCRTARNLARVKMRHGIKQDNDKKHKRKQKLVKEDDSFHKRLLLVAIQEGGWTRGFIDGGCVDGRWRGDGV